MSKSKDVSPLLPTLRKLKRLSVREQELRAQLKEERGNLNFSCVCGSIHLIKECEVLQTHWYTSPSGCTDGDYWNEGELQIVCPVTQVRNRLLARYSPTFHGADAEKAFMHMFSLRYKDCFKSITDTYRELPDTPWANNYTIRDHAWYYLPEVK